MSQRQDVTITLTDDQVAQVGRSLPIGELGLSNLFASFADLKTVSRTIRAIEGDAHYSRSTLRALLVLAAFPTDGTSLALADVAKRLEYSASTTHRYLATWLATGLLEQEPRSRKYHRPRRSEGESNGHDAEGNGSRAAVHGRVG